MELSTWFRWRQMEEAPSILQIRQGLSMELVIVMLNAVEVPSFMVKLPQKIGEIMEPVAPSLISGKPTSKQVFTLAILARLLGIIGAKETNVDLVLKDIKEFVIKMAVG
jgi:hypothetical protein